MYQDDINYERLREDLFRESMGAAFGGGFGGAFIQAEEIKKASEHITPLKLQKLLYYVQGMSLFYFNKEAFSNKIMAWSYGPVVEEIYEQYKRNGKAEINLFVRDNDVSKGLNEIIDEVVKYYGKYSATWLVELTHDEDPWKDTEHNQEISKEKIKKYFEEVYK